ncbi:MAG: glycosyltransferase family 4 protein [Fibrobacter sp.]|jgi:glycosyltransferase involved in cell wall biosynthesis|nr:glycosyltransferase family 4 protein [Fibrobacter sp.]
MHIIVFNEYYPNPFKPSLTTEIEQFLNDNHKLTLFAMGGYWNPIDPKVRELGLDRLIRYLPTTLNSLPRFLGSSTKALLRNPLGRISAATRIIRSSSSFKRNLINIFRMLQLPLSSPDLCLVHNLNTMRSLTFLRSLYPGVPVALYYHGGELPGMSIISNDIAASAFDSANVVFTNTENSKSQAISRGCPPHKIFAIPVGFNISEFKPPKQRQYYRQKQLRLLSIGRFSVEKGLIYALNGLVQLIDQGITQWQYRLIGNGPQEAELKDFVKNNNITDKVLFLGLLSRKEVLSELEQADALLLPSISIGVCQESQACVVQEAMLMKTLVVTTQTGGVPESIAPQMQRFCLPAQDSSAIAECIKELMSLDQSQWQILGEACRDFAVSNYDITRLIKKMLECCFRTESYA